MPRPLCDVWNHYRMLSDDKVKRHVECLYCSREYKVGNATRMAKHIADCKSSPRDVKDAFKDRKTINKKRESATSVNSNSNSDVSLDNSGIESPVQKSRKLLSDDLKPWINIENEDDGKSQTSCINDDVTIIITRDKHKKQETQKLSLVCHGWVNGCGKGVVNLIVAAPKPIYFITANLECELEPEYIGQKILDVLGEFGSTKFTAIVTNNDSTMKQAWKLVKSKYPQISCVGCISYGINLLYEDLLKIQVFKATMHTVFNAITHIKNNEILSELFEKQQIEHYGSTKCTLKLPNQTRLIGVILALNSFKSNKEALQTLVKTTTNPVDANIRKDILNEVLWFKIEEMLNILQIVSEILQSLESENATLSDVPAAYFNLCTAINDQLESNAYFSNEDIVNIKLTLQTKKNILQPIHLAANLLDPRYRGTHLEDDTPVATDFIADYAAFIHRNDQEKISEVLANIAHFKTKTGYYGKSSSIWKPVQLIQPSIWWHTFAQKEIISPIAIRLLSVPPSSAGRQFNSFEVSNADTVGSESSSKLKKFGSGPSKISPIGNQKSYKSVKKDETFEFIETNTFSDEE